MRVGIGLVGFGLSCYPSSHIFSMPIQIGFFRSKWSMKTDICRLRGPNMIAFCLGMLFCSDLFVVKRNSPQRN